MDNAHGRGKMYQCKFCGYSSDKLEDFEADKQFHKGYWCPWCDGFTYFENEPDNHSYLLFLESKKQTGIETMPTDIKLPPRISPLRYPGGKSKVASLLYQSCNKEHLKNFIEPFAGGASVGLSLLLSGKIENLYLNDADYGIYALFEIIKCYPLDLYEKIRKFVPSKEAFYHARTIVENDYKNCNTVEAAWNILVVNRLAFSGISKANCMSNPFARWNAKELIKRMERIHNFAEHIQVSNMDAIEYIEEKYWLSDATMLIDPPYFKKGKDLYHCFYQKEDHDKLAWLLDDLYKGMPGADMIVTYDMADYIKELYDYPTIRELNRKYSIAN